MNLFRNESCDASDNTGTPDLSIDMNIVINFQNAKDRKSKSRNSDKETIDFSIAKQMETRRYGS